MIDELERLLNAATPRPWAVRVDNYDQSPALFSTVVAQRKGRASEVAYIASTDMNGSRATKQERHANAAAIVAAVNAAPTLIEAARAVIAWADADAAGRHALQGHADLSDALRHAEAAESRLRAIAKTLKGGAK